jgi:hypothetical protein
VLLLLARASPPRLQLRKKGGSMLVRAAPPAPAVCGDSCSSSCGSLGGTAQRHAHGSTQTAACGVTGML